MAPLPSPTGVASLERWSTVLEPQNHWSTVLLVSLFAAVLRSVVVVFRKRKKRVSGSGRNLEGSSMEKEELAVNQRKDSPQIEEMDVHADKHDSPIANSKKKDVLEARRDDTVGRVSPEQNQNDHLASLQQETLEPTLLPIYPWTAPPQPLPGPYDAPYYPLPLPTIALEENAEDDTQPQNTRGETSPDDSPEELETIAYSRRIPIQDAPENELVRASVITVSTKGWRRTQWTVNG